MNDFTQEVDKAWVIKYHYTLESITWISDYLFENSACVTSKCVHDPTPFILFGCFEIIIRVATQFYTSA